MDGLTLLHEASLAGLSVLANGQQLTLRGSKRYILLAQQLLQQKLDVIDAWELYEERLAIILESDELCLDEASALAWMCLGYPGVFCEKEIA